MTLSLVKIIGKFLTCDPKIAIHGNSYIILISRWRKLQVTNAIELWLLCDVLNDIQIYHTACSVHLMEMNSLYWQRNARLQYLQCISNVNNVVLHDGIMTKIHLQGIALTSWWAWWRLKSPASWLFTQPFFQAQIKENIKAPRHWHLCGKFTGDRWILRTNGQ